MIDLTIHEDTLAKAAERARERDIIIPTFKQMIDPSAIPAVIQDELSGIDLWETHPRNLFRINWHNEPVPSGGRFGPVNCIELPSALTGVPARIIALVGKWFPTGCHKVGAAFGCLVPRLVTGQFDPTCHKAAWPSTGNYCRGGAYNSKLLDCYSIAILPEGMSRERFDWLKTVASEIIATPGSESNVKEIFDAVADLRQNRADVMIFNQFEELGNALWHYQVTGRAAAEAIQAALAAGPEGGRFFGSCFTTGSAGTISAGDYLKEAYPASVVAVSEALQCPTLTNNGFGEHRIEGIGDKHVPWIHNVRNTDMVIDIDDDDSQNLLRLFNSEAGRQYLKNEAKVPEETVDRLDLFGISGIANILCCIKFAKYYELTQDDVVATVATDSADLYTSRIAELDERQGEYGMLTAARDFGLHLLGCRTDNMLELTFEDRRKIHNLKYYTWIEQQGRDAAELNAQWYDDGYWDAVHRQAETLDGLIREFNEASGVLRSFPQGGLQ